MDDATQGILIFSLIGGGILLFGVLPWLLGRLLRLRAARRVKRVRTTDAADGKPCRLVGRVLAHPEHPHVVARFSGREVLYSLTKLVAFVPHDPNSETDNPFREKARETAAVDAFWLEDESGRVLVRLFNPGTERELTLEQRRSYKSVPMEQVEALLAHNGRSLGWVDEGFPWGQAALPADYHIDEELLTEGEQVVVVGTCRHEAAPGGAGGGGYREAPVLRVVQGERNRPLRIYSTEKDVQLLGR